MLTPYPKPTRFSDPYNDWYGCEEILNPILSKELFELTLWDFGRIFAPIAPAANYEEGMYYLDACFRLMRSQQEIVQTNLCDGAFWFINHFRERIQSDGFFDECLSLASGLFADYTSTFELIRFTDQELEDYKISATYREYVKYSQSIHDLVDIYVEYEDFAPILDSAIEELNEVGDVKSCWWLEISYHARWWFILHDPKDLANARKQHLLHRLLLLSDYPDHERRAREYLRSVCFNEYYERVSII